MNKNSIHEENEKRINLNSLPKNLKNEEFITQGFIIKVKDCDVRVRSLEDSSGNVTYTMTAKFRPDHQESEMEISKEMFDSLFPHTSQKMQKARYHKSGWDIDQFENGNIVAEYEFSSSEKSVDIPKDWDVEGHVSKLIKDAHWVQYVLNGNR